MAKKNITPNKERMYSYAKGGGLMGYMNGGGVLDNKQGGGGIVSAVKAITKNIPKAQSALKHLAGEWVNKGKLPIKKSTINSFLEEPVKKIDKKKVKNK